MGKIVLATLVGLWLFTLARLVAGGLTGYETVDQATPYVAPTSALIAARQDLAEHAERPLAAGATFAVRAVQASTDASAALSIRLMLAGPAIVDIDLFDSSGRRVLTHTSHRLPGGNSSVQVQSEAPLAPGRYWLRTRIGDEIATRPLAIEG